MQDTQTLLAVRCTARDEVGLVARLVRLTLYCHERIAIRAPQILYNFRIHCSSSIDGSVAIVRLPVDLLIGCPAFTGHPDHRSMPFASGENR